MTLWVYVWKEKQTEVQVGAKYLKRSAQNVPYFDGYVACFNKIAVEVCWLLCLCMCETIMPVNGISASCSKCDFIFIEHEVFRTYVNLYVMRSHNRSYHQIGCKLEVIDICSVRRWLCDRDIAVNSLTSPVKFYVQPILCAYKEVLTQKPCFVDVSWSASWPFFLHFTWVCIVQWTHQFWRIFSLIFAKIFLRIQNVRSDVSNIQFESLKLVGGSTSDGWYHHIHTNIEKYS